MISDPGPRLDWIGEGFDPVPAQVRDVVSVLDELGHESVKELFAAYGLRIEESGPTASQRRPSQAPPRSPTAAFISSIGFSSEELCGSILLGLARRVADGTVPIRGGNLADWTSELDNQLLGRFKNRLVRYGIYLEMSVPMAITADMLLAAPPGRIVRHHAFASKCGPLWLRLDLDVNPSLELAAYAAGASEPMLAEGEVLFF